MLLEFLEPHTRREDVRERARALAPGASVRVVMPGDEPRAEGELVPTPGWVEVRRGAWRDALCEALAMAGPAAAVVLAGDEAIETAQGAPELDGLDVRLWPTRLDGDPARDRVTLECAVAAVSRGMRARDSLWDGDYVLVPGMPDDAAAALVIEGFAELAVVRPSLDLVFLADRVPRFEPLVRDLGVRWHVHWAGRAPLRAECTWLAGASAVLVTDREAADASQMLRAVAVGTPVVAAGAGGRARHLHAWLRETGACSVDLALTPGALARALAAPAAAGEARERSLRLVRAHEPRALAAQLDTRLIPGSRLAA